MTAARINTEERKKLIADLWIIGMVTFLALGIAVFAMQTGMNNFAGDQGLCRPSQYLLTTTHQGEPQ